MTQTKLIFTSEICKHHTNRDCWLVIDNQVWDMTSFAPDHPGGAGIIYKYAGRDATAAYAAVHAPSTVKDGLPEHALKGSLDTSTMADAWRKPLADQHGKAESEKPPLHTLINAHDFELAAKATATPKTWAFYSSAATDLVTRDANASIYRKIWFRPRTMRNVTTCSTGSSILGHPVALPLMIAPAAMARLIHPDGELAMARAAAAKGVIQLISTNASFSALEIAAQAPHHPFFFQLYVNRDRGATERLLATLSAAENIKAILVTVDAAAPGKREADERVSADESLSSGYGDPAKNDKKGGGYGRIMGGFIDPGLCWDDVKWLRGLTKLPLVLEGVMSADDVKMASEAGLDGVMLSNHGGRNLDNSPQPIMVLLEVWKRFPEVLMWREQERRMEIYVDGGIRRGTDILKCLCLGATGVSVGRSFLYATGYGQEGVAHLIDVLQDELEVAMKNSGITKVADAAPDLVNTAELDWKVPRTREHPYVRDWGRERPRL